APNIPEAHHEFRRSTCFVGRERQLEELTKAYTSLGKGEVVIAMVQGLSGVGKSTLVAHFADELKAMANRPIVLTGRCHPQESVPYKALDGAIDSLCRYWCGLGFAEASALLPLDITSLVKLFPVLERVGAVKEAPKNYEANLDPIALRRRGFTALREVFARLCQRRSVVLCLDDLQWGDRDSALLLSEIVRPPHSPAILIIGSFRSEERENSAFLNTLSMSDLELEGFIRPVEVKALSWDQSVALAEKLLESAELGSLAKSIADESGGSPLFIAELVRYVKREDTREEASLLGLSLDQVLMSRIKTLPQSSQSLLTTVAVAGRPTQQQAATAASAIEVDARKAIRLLIHEHLLRRGGSSTDSLVTFHDRIAEVVVAELDDQEISDHHLKLALALEAQEGADPEALFTHFSGASQMDKAREYAVVTAHQAVEAFAFVRAAEFFELALVDSPGNKQLQLDL
ncbi:MAG: AAA family ATPase, partial [Proteobacteria bacterium]|nr:AAA family ATPase [Pseudomonadota bacterium]